jgi:arsenate reductase (glutaredoxin)
MQRNPELMKSTKPMRVHGIANCDTVKRARAWLGGRAVDYDWVDFRKQPPSIDQIRRWARSVGWEALLNRRGTTWRSLDDGQRAALRDEASAIALMHERPTLIRRPVVEDGDDIVVGFDEPDYLRRFAAR